MTTETEQQQPAFNIAPMDILFHPNPILDMVCDPVSEQEFGTEKLNALVGSMMLTMISAKGVGIAAPQVGINRRIFIALSENENGAEPAVYINPTIEPVGDEMIPWKEGCLSIPNLEVTIRRHKTINVTAYNTAGEMFTETLTGLAAVCVQHEIDHLDGIQMLARMTKHQQRKMIDKIRANRKSAILVPGQY